MDPNHHVFEMLKAIERTSTILQSMSADITEIKEGIVPNGKKRMDDVETDIKGLNNFKYLLSTIGGFTIGIIPFSDKIIEFFSRGSH